MGTHGPCHGLSPVPTPMCPSLGPWWAGTPGPMHPAGMVQIWSPHHDPGSWGEKNPSHEPRFVVTATSLLCAGSKCRGDGREPHGLAQVPEQHGIGMGKHGCSSAPSLSPRSAPAATPSSSAQFSFQGSVASGDSALLACSQVSANQDYALHRQPPQGRGVAFPHGRRVCPP